LRTHRVFLHNHSTWSDGHMSLGAIERLGERLGASAVVMSEHDFDFTPTKWGNYVQACREASTLRCVIIPGIEYSSPNDDIHVVTMGTSRFHGARNDLLETLSSVRMEGGAAVLAHPRRRDSFNKVSSDLVDLLDGIEIWNRKVDGFLPVNTYFRLAQNRGLAPIVAMDLHTWRQIFPMWNEIPAGPEALDGNTVATALRSRLIAPACILGKLEAGLDRGFSLTLSTLAAAEQLRLLLRNVRDAARRN
jgi:hypothetical protein